MKRDEVFKSCEQRAGEIEDGTLDLAVEFKAAGRANVYFGGIDRNSFLPVVIVGKRGDTFIEAARTGQIISLEKHQVPYDRALVMERGIIAELSEEDALRLGTSRLSYEDVDASFCLPPPEP